MARSGCRLIFVGFETPNLKEQKFIKKGINRAKSVAKVAYFNSLGIKFIGSFIGGFPGETENELNNTLYFALECSVGLTVEQLRKRVRGINQNELSLECANFCMVHPLAFMPGTEFDAEFRNKVRFCKYVLNNDSYGTHISGLDDFIKKNWRLILNPFVTFLSEEEVHFFYPILRLFNFVVFKPYYFAWILTSREVTPVKLLNEMVDQLGREFVLQSNIPEFSRRFSELLNSYLGISAKWCDDRVIKG